MSEAPRDHEPEQSLLAVPPALARLALGTWLRGTGMALGATVHTWRRLATATRSGESAGEMIAALRDDAVGGARRILGVTDLEQRLRGGGATGAHRPESDAAASPNGGPPDLRARGLELLRRSAELADDDDDVHPAYLAILEQMAPDEARIVRLLAQEGPQPIVDVHAVGRLGRAPRELARHLSMVGRMAGCMHPERVPAYLDNLTRLGIVRVSREPIDDDDAYGLLEAQPEVIEAERRAGGGGLLARTSRRSLCLTELGADFCARWVPAPAES